MDSNNGYHRATTPLDTIPNIVRGKALSYQSEQGPGVFRAQKKSRDRQMSQNGQGQQTPSQNQKTFFKAGSFSGNERLEKQSTATDRTTERIAERGTERSDRNERNDEMPRVRLSEGPPIDGIIFSRSNSVAQIGSSSSGQMGRLVVYRTAEERYTVFSILPINYEICVALLMIPALFVTFRTTAIMPFRLTLTSDAYNYIPFVAAAAEK